MMRLSTLRSAPINRDSKLEREVWIYRYSIDISLLWSEKLNKSTNPKLFYRHIAPPR